MLVYIAAFLVTLSQFNPGITLTHVYDQLGEGLEQVVVIAESQTAQVDSETVANQEPSESDEESALIPVAKEVATTTFEENRVTTIVPQTTVIEEAPMDVPVDNSKPVQTGPSVAGPSMTDVAKAWPQLSEEARESILLLIEIDLKVD